MPVLEPAKIRLSKALWLAAFPSGPSEADWYVEDFNSRRQINELLPAATEEWKSAGRDPADLHLFDESVFRIGEGYSRVQAYSRRPGYEQVMGPILGPGLNSLMNAAAAHLRRDDLRVEALDKAEDMLLHAGHRGYVRFFGRPEDVVLTEMREIDSTFFRLPRLISAEMDYENRVGVDPHDERQAGHYSFLEVEVEFQSFKHLMLAAGFWSEDSLPVRLYGLVADYQDQEVPAQRLDEKEAEDTAPTRGPFDLAGMARAFVERWIVDHGREPASGYLVDWLMTEARVSRAKARRAVLPLHKDYPTLKDRGRKRASG